MIHFRANHARRAHVPTSVSLDVRGFVRRYGLTSLVYFEHHEDIRDAIQRETSLKRWPRAWKVRLLASGNPEWRDLYPSLLG